MLEAVVVRKNRSRWYLSVDGLYGNKVASICWKDFLPKGCGTKHQRAYLLSSIKSLLGAMIEAPRQSNGEILSHATILNWTLGLRRLVLWMLQRDIWRFSALSANDVADYIEHASTRHDGAGGVSQQTLYFRVRQLQEMWELRDQYSSGLRVNPASLEIEALQRRRRPTSSWKALDEPAALSLIGDAISWVESHGEYLLAVRHRRWRLEQCAVAICKRAKHRRILNFYKEVAQEAEYEQLSEQIAKKDSRTYLTLQKAMSMTDGACYVILLFLEGMRVSELIRLDSGCLKAYSGEDGNEIVKLHGVAAKQGGRERTWITCEPVVQAINYFERAFSEVREVHKLKALVINHPHGLAALGKGATRAPRGVIAQRMQLFSSNRRRAGSVVQHLHPHMARKTFARFVVARDKRALESLSYHLDTFTERLQMATMLVVTWSFKSCSMKRLEVISLKD
ncbi:site-specific integrase [Paraburkholderia caledonica]|uniref:hypothetical protein n=1 Tax=Paraburkholderia caledonica TaxID=134536 RepID=UPI00039FE877|nr:hypothetical protein [Paraburkholderia caledonica]